MTETNNESIKNIYENIKKRAGNDPITLVSFLAKVQDSEDYILLKNVEHNKAHLHSFTLNFRESSDEKNIQIMEEYASKKDFLFFLDSQKAKEHSTDLMAQTFYNSMKKSSRNEKNN
jgi:hypothetical protein